MLHPGWIATIIFVTDLVLRVGLSLRIISRRLPVGVSLAWLFVVLVFPFAGAIGYLMLGELRLGRKRAVRAAALHAPYYRWVQEVGERAGADWFGCGPACEPLAQLAHNALGVPPLGGNAWRLLPDWKTALGTLINDIDAARRTCHLEFYIWHEGGLADEVAEALLRAVQRGVICRVLLDDVGSRRFLRGGLAARMRKGGVQLHAALPASLFRMLLVRFDLRMHRKLAIIDGHSAYTGSLNLVDPGYFKQDAGVGEWVDAMVRVQGPVVEALAITFLEDWALETGESLDHLEKTGDVHPNVPRGNARVQAMPSGPAQHTAAMQRILVSAIYFARREITLTSPYFVPDESLLNALVSAAERGVVVRLIVPALVDSHLVRWASRAYLGDLARAGVRVLLFEGGLLHTKSVMIDGELSLFGSLNLDPRSLKLNFEITLGFYDSGFSASLGALQAAYAGQSSPFDVDEWMRRNWFNRLVDNTARLLGPLL